MRGITVAYYATISLIGAGLTLLLGYEAGWLFAHSPSALGMAGAFVPCVVFLAWALGQEL
jgi:hypothetical protein